MFHLFKNSIKELTNRDNKVILSFNSKDVLENLLEKNSIVKKISFSQFYPGKTNQYREAQLTLNGENKQVSFDLISADAEFFEMLGLQLVSGRLFTDNLSFDKEKIVVNEAFLRQNNIANIEL